MIRILKRDLGVSFIAHWAMAVFDADHIAAENIRQRKYDRGISRYLNYREIKRVLEKRFRRTASVMPETARARSYL